MTKKLFLSVITFLSFSAIIFAQDYKKNIVGIRVGINYATFNISGSGNASNINEYDPRTSFHVGIINQHRISTNHWYVGAGLFLSDKGIKFNDNDVDKLKLMYLEIPLMLEYHFSVASIVKIQPAVGGYFAYGISGDFGEKTQIKRFDMGLRFQLGASFQHIYVEINSELSLPTIATSNGDISKGDLTLRNICWGLSVGYNF